MEENIFIPKQSTSFESINSWVLVFGLRIKPDFKFFYSFGWLLFQLYGESINVSYIADLYHWSLGFKKIPKSLLCCSHCSRIKPLSVILQLPWPFMSATPWYQFITSSLWWFVLYFSGLRRLNCTKNDPTGVFFRVFIPSKYENNNEHVLVRARKIHESVTLSSIILSPLQSCKRWRETQVNFPGLVKI